MLDKHKPQETYLIFFLQNYELWLKYEIEKKCISSIFTGHDLEQNTF